MVNRENLDKFNSEFKTYLEKVVAGLNPLLDKERTPYNNFLYHLFNFYIFTSFLVDRKLSLTQEIHPLMLLYNKSSLSLFGIYSCLKNGLIIDASLILRSIFENFITVELILQADPLERTKLYGEYEHVAKWNHIRNCKELLKKGVIDQDEFDRRNPSSLVEEAEKNYERVKPNYHPKTPYHWAWKIFQDELKGGNPKIKFICKKLSLENDYVMIYSTLSTAVHGNPQIKNLMVVGGSFSLAPNFSHLIYSVGTMGLNYCSEIVKKIVGFVNPSNKEEIENFIITYLEVVRLEIESKITKPIN